MAPLAATLATGMAVGVGVALVRSERERRRQRAREAREQLGLAPGESLAAGLRRMSLAQLDLALELLQGGEGAPDEHTVHETRKAIKRLRALLRLLRQELGERAYERETAALRRIAHQLSQARDATVMLATLDGLIERHPRRLGRRRGVLALRRRVAAERTRLSGQTLAEPAQRAAVLGELHALRWRVCAWALPAGEGLRLVDADLRRLYRQGRRRHRHLQGGGGERTVAMHKWRKRVKDLRYVAEALERRDSHGRRVVPGRPQRARRSAKRLHQLAGRADELGELLGQEHDLAVLADHLRAGQPGLWRVGKASRRALLKAIAKRRCRLRRRALRRGTRLYEAKPGRFMRDLRTAV